MSAMLHQPEGVRRLNESKSAVLIYISINKLGRAHTANNFELSLAALLAIPI
jgi:hypothetical protein